MDAQQIINMLKLEPLPDEGGFFSRTYKSPELISQQALPDRYPQAMAFGSAIYFLLTADDFSAMHRLQTDEIYHFYLGDPVEMLLLHPDGTGEIFTLGIDLAAGMRPQKVVQRDIWQGSRLAAGGSHGFALMGTTLAPGFEWADFELGQRDDLISKYPNFADAIAARVR